MKIFDKEINFSFTDVDNIEKIDKELDDIGNITEDIKFENYIEELKYTCSRIKQFFNTVIAEGFCDDIPNDYDLLINEFNSFNEMFVEVNKQSSERINKAKSKYDLKRVKR